MLRSVQYEWFRISAAFRWLIVTVNQSFWLFPILFIYSQYYSLFLHEQDSLATEPHILPPIMFPEMRSLSDIASLARSGTSYSPHEAPFNGTAWMRYLHNKSIWQFQNLMMTSESISLICTIEYRLLLPLRKISRVRTTSPGVSSDLIFSYAPEEDG
jgi:hypothetical protein